MLAIAFAFARGREERKGGTARKEVRKQVGKKTTEWASG